MVRDLRNIIQMVLLIMGYFIAYTVKDTNIKLFILVAVVSICIISFIITTYKWVKYRKFIKDNYVVIKRGFVIGNILWIFAVLYNLKRQFQFRQTILGNDYKGINIFEYYNQLAIGDKIASWILITLIIYVITDIIRETFLKQVITEEGLLILGVGVIHFDRIKTIEIKDVLFNLAKQIEIQYDKGKVVVYVKDKSYGLLRRLLSNNYSGSLNVYDKGAL